MLHSLSTTRWSIRADNCKVLEKNIVSVHTTLTIMTIRP